MYVGPDIVDDGLEGAIDGGSWDRMNGTQTGSNYYVGLLEGTPAQRCFVDGDTTIPSTTPYNFGFGADRNTHIQIPDADGAFPANDGPFDFSAGAGYTVDVWVMRTAFGTWQSGGTTNYDGIWNYYWNHSLSFSGAHTGVNKIQGTGLSGFSISMNTWYNVIMTHDNTNTSQHKVYINNNLEQTSTVGNAGSARRFFVGNWDSNWSMVGNVPIIRVYNRPLTSSEVTKNWNSTKNRFGL